MYYGTNGILRMKRRAEGRVAGRLADRFRQRRVPVTDAGEILGTAGIFHYGNWFCDHVRRPWSENVNAEQAIRLRIGQDLYQTFAIPYVLSVKK